MARITSEQRELNRQKYDSVIFDIFISEGWHEITFGRISKELGISPSSLQRYYPTRIDFSKALQGKVFPLVVGKLDLSSPNSFVKSWEEALKEGGVFSSMILMLIQNSTSIHSSPHSVLGIKKLINALSQHMSQNEAEEAIKLALGSSILFFLNQ
jgi:hypothetical protein